MSLLGKPLKAGTEGCQRMRDLYGAGQDLLKDSFSGNVKGMGPGVAELEFEERPNEAYSPCLCCRQDRTRSFQLSDLYRMFVDGLSNTGLNCEQITC